MNSLNHKSLAGGDCLSICRTAHHFKMFISPPCVYLFLIVPVWIQSVSFLVVFDNGPLCTDYKMMDFMEQLLLSHVIWHQIYSPWAAVFRWILYSAGAVRWKLLLYGWWFFFMRQSHVITDVIWNGKMEKEMVTWGKRVYYLCFCVLCKLFFHSLPQSLSW